MFLSVNQGKGRYQGYPKGYILGYLVAIETFLDWLFGNINGILVVHGISVRGL